MYLVYFPGQPKSASTSMPPFWMLLERGWWIWWWQPEQSCKTCNAPVKIVTTH